MDNNTTITLNTNTPMKEIPMSDLKDNIENNDAFRKFVATGSAIVEAGRELMEENARLRKECEDLRKENDTLKLEGEMRTDIMEVLTSHNIGDADKLDEILSEPTTTPSDYQMLKDFKGEIDAIHEEFEIPRDVDALRKDLQLGKNIKEAIEEKTEIYFSASENPVGEFSSLLDDYNAYREACDNHMIDPDELDSKLDDYDAMDTACSDHGVEPGDLDDTLTEWEDHAKYKKGFEELSEFVDKVKEACDEFPSTDIEDYD